MKKTGLWLALVVGLQTLWMFGTAISKETHLRSDKTVLLETMPVDPRDMLRGDYVILNYKISTIQTDWLYAGTTPVSLPPANLNGRTVYVTLEKKGQFYEAVGAGLEPAKPKAGQVVAQGTLDDSWRTSANGTIRVKYGIEKYFVPEGTGNPRGKLTVQCVVAADRSLLIKQVFVDGKPYKTAVATQ